MTTTPTTDTTPTLPPLHARLLHLIATLEGGMSAVAGDFDGQLLSFGPLQWNIGQGTLQPLLRDLACNPPGATTLSQCLGRDFVQACREGEPKLSSYVRRQYKRGRLNPDFVRGLKALALHEGTLSLFVAHAQPYFAKAEAAAQQLGFKSERGLALLVDIAVQNGVKADGLRADHMQAYQRGLQRLPANAAEWQKLKVLAHAVADCANPRWHDDVLARKLSIALGGTEQSGMAVHGRHFNLERDFRLSYGREWV